MGGTQDLLVQTIGRVTCVTFMDNTVLDTTVIDRYGLWRGDRSLILAPRT